MENYRELKVRYANPPQFFKSIRFRTEFPNKITGNLIYIRKHYDGYDYIQGDNIDTSLIELFQGLFSNVSKGFQTNLILEEQLENALKVTRGGVEKNIIFYFTVRPSYELVEKYEYSGGLKAVPIELKVTLQTGDEQIANQVIQNEYIVCLEEESMRRIRTIKSI